MLQKVFLQSGVAAKTTFCVNKKALTFAKVTNVGYVA